MADRMEREKRKRTVLRTATTKILTKIQKELQKEDADCAVLNTILAQLSEKETMLFKANEVIEELIVDLDLLEDEINNREEYREKIIEEKMRAQKRQEDIAAKERATSSASSNTGTTTSTGHQEATQVTVRLPQLVIDKFSGDACEWQNFWSKFSSAIHENRNLANVDKFNYLKTYLDRNALTSIAGLPLTSENYEQAIAILKQRFGRADVLVAAHMNRLLGLEPVKRSSDIAALRRLYDNCEIQIRSLETMGMASGSYGSLLCPLLFKLIPEELTLEFNRKSNAQQVVEVTELLEFIRKEVESRERTQMVTRRSEPYHQLEGSDRSTNLLQQKGSFGSRSQTSRASWSEMNKKEPRIASAAALQTVVERICVFCDSGDHKSDECNKFSVAEKKDLLKTRGRCYICYKKRHLARHCRENITCPNCKRRHRKALCWQGEQGKSEQNSNAVVATMVPKRTREGVSPKAEVVFLQTVRAIAAGYGSNTEVRCLLDGGSQRTFIREDLSKSLKLPLVGEEHLSLHTFGNDQPTTTKLKRVGLRLQNKHETGKFLDIEALEIPEICTATIQVPSKELLKRVIRMDIRLSDQNEENCEDCKIGILIGSDLYWRIAMSDIERISNTLVAQNTLLGWTLQGATSTSGIPTESTNVRVMKTVIADGDVDDHLASVTLKKMWEIEALGVMDSPGISLPEEETMEAFNSTVAFKDGRYVVKLPWKEKKDGWPDNYGISEKRLRSLVRKFQQKPVFYKQYKDVIEDHLRTGIAEKVTETGQRENGAIFYLPHQAVIRPEKATTKLRVVFDASAHAQNKPSLNDLLYAGPNLNPDLLNLLVRFRTNRVAIVSDIEKAFLQIELDAEDRDAVRFLWINDAPSDEVSLRELRMTRVLFGVKSSPFLLAAVLRHHIGKYQRSYPRECQALVNSLYVDDLVHGANSEEEAFNISINAYNILKEANFTLRKWQTNSSALKEKWKSAGFDIEHPASAVGGKPVCHKVLGLLWDVQADAFKFNTTGLQQFVNNSQPTKRSILQATGRIFDPLGFLAPFTIRTKILFQQLWERGLGWDHELPEDARTLWKIWCRELERLDQITVPRYCLQSQEGDQSSKIRLHCFTDASERAYGAVIYARYTTKSGSTTVAFIAAKARVAPLKKLSIPKLELMGALVAARLVEHISRELEGHLVQPCQFWTDSMITLCWIQSDSGQWKPFVSNRVQDIQKRTDPAAWRHCPGYENPADFLTRGKQAAQLKENNEWWEGPRWLKLDETEWPKTTTGKILKSEHELEKRKKNKSASQCLFGMTTAVEPLLDLEKYSALSKVLRVTAWVRRFAYNIRHSAERQRGPLEAEEIRRAEIFWIMETQKQAFDKEMKALASKKEIKRDSRVLNLSPFLDGEGLLRVGGRLQEANLTFDGKHPYLLPDKNAFTKLQINAKHQEVEHSGLADTLAQIRENMWILRARQATKAVINECRICRRQRAKPMSEAMAPLPRERVTTSPPFEVTGVDFAGPVYIKEKAEILKSYIALFTCAVTRAVHLELVSDLTTDKFILAFKRFVARRGVSKIVYSDNAKTFKAADKTLKALWSGINEEELRDFFGKRGVTWRYIVERAPWWGGFWERMVRSVKNCLRKILGRASLNFEELTTVSTQVEAVINSRPLTYISNDSLDPEPLTPAHFLVGKRLTSIPGRVLSFEHPSSTIKELCRRFVYQQNIIDRFWKRWQDEYLMELRSAHWQPVGKRTNEVKEGDVVLLQEVGTPRLLWKMGVMEVFRGRDGKVRSCSLRFQEGRTLRRPIQLLCPLEAAPEVDEPERSKVKQIAKLGAEDVETRIAPQKKAASLTPFRKNGSDPRKCPSRPALGQTANETGLPPRKYVATPTT